MTYSYPSDNPSTYVVNKNKLNNMNSATKGSVIDYLNDVLSL